MISGRRVAPTESRRVSGGTVKYRPALATDHEGGLKRVLKLSFR